MISTLQNTRTHSDLSYSSSGCSLKSAKSALLNTPVKLLDLSAGFPHADGKARQYLLSPHHHALATLRGRPTNINIDDLKLGAVLGKGSFAVVCHRALLSPEQPAPVKLYGASDLHSCASNILRQSLERPVHTLCWTTHVTHYA